MAVAANNLGELGVSLITPQQEASAGSSQDDPGDYADRCIEQINNLVNGVVAAAGRVMSLATVGSRHSGWDSRHCQGRTVTISWEPPYPRQGSSGPLPR